MQEAGEVHAWPFGLWEGVERGRSFFRVEAEGSPIGLGAEERGHMWGNALQEKGERWLGTYERGIALRYQPMFETAFEEKSI